VSEQQKPEDENVYDRIRREVKARQEAEAERREIFKHFDNNRLSKELRERFGGAQQ
jgi:hypothetical protein